MRVLVDAHVLEILFARAREVDFVEDFLRRPPVADEREHEVAEAQRSHNDVVERRAHGLQTLSRIEPVPDGAVLLRGVFRLRFGGARLFRRSYARLRAAQELVTEPEERSD